MIQRLQTDFSSFEGVFSRRCFFYVFGSMRSSIDAFNILHSFAKNFHKNIESGKNETVSWRTFIHVDATFFYVMLRRFQRTNTPTLGNVPLAFLNCFLKRCNWIPRLWQYSSFIIFQNGCFVCSLLMVFELFRLFFTGSLKNVRCE